MESVATSVSWTTEEVYSRRGFCRLFQQAATLLGRRSVVVSLHDPLLVEADSEALQGVQKVFN